MKPTSTSRTYCISQGAVQPARCPVCRYEFKNGKFVDGFGAWCALELKYHSLYSHRSQLHIATKLVNWRMEEGSDLDILFREIKKLIEELGVVGERVSEDCNIDVISSRIISDYDIINFFLMKSLNFSACANI